MQLRDEKDLANAEATAWDIPVCYSLCCALMAPKFAQFSNTATFRSQPAKPSPLNHDIRRKYC